MVASRHAQINKAKNMKKAFFILTAALAIAACGNQPQKKAVEATFIGEETTVDGFALKVDGDTIKFTEVVKPQVDLAAFPVDEEGYIVIFDGSSLAGWRSFLTVLPWPAGAATCATRSRLAGPSTKMAACISPAMVAEKPRAATAATLFSPTSSRISSSSSTGRFPRAAIPASSTWPVKLLPPSRTAP